MTLFARCFLLVFCQLGVGGLLALAVPPFHELERGFFKSSAAVFLFASLVGGGGTVYLLVSRAASGVSGLEAVLWTAHGIVFALYLSTLWGEAMLLRARLYVAALLSGMAALGVSTYTLSDAGGALAGILGTAGTMVSAVALGAVTTGMLIGHWYLVDPGMEIEPFRRCYRFFVRALWAEIAVLAAIGGALVVGWGGGRAPEAVADHALLLGLRVLLGPFAALMIAVLIGRVLAIPQTMAATGLFYVATLAVLVGEFLGRYFTFRTGLPF